VHLHLVSASSQENTERQEMPNASIHQRASVLNWRLGIGPFFLMGLCWWQLTPLTQCANA